MDIWKFQARLTTLLLGWAIASIAAGTAWLRRDEPLLKGLGEQFAGWGLVNALIALVGRSSAGRRQHLPEMATHAAQEIERRKIARLLWVNTALDVVYMLGGITTARTRGAADERWRGRGLGILIQGGFLFFFDLIHALRLGWGGWPDRGD